MSQNKTRPNDRGVKKFVSGISDEKKREDALSLLELMKQATKTEPRMWGDSLIGFGSYHYRYDSGREGDYFMTGFSPRKQNLTIYIMPGFDKYKDIMKRLGRYTTGKSCLYIKKLEDVDLTVLKELIRQSFTDMKKANK